jgi:hypothetical protein
MSAPNTTQIPAVFAPSIATVHLYVICKCDVALKYVEGWK